MALWCRWTHDRCCYGMRSTSSGSVVEVSNGCSILVFLLRGTVTVLRRCMHSHGCPRCQFSRWSFVSTLALHPWSFEVCKTSATSDRVNVLPVCSNGVLKCSSRWRPLFDFEFRGLNLTGICRRHFEQTSTSSIIDSNSGQLVASTYMYLGFTVH